MTAPVPTLLRLLQFADSTFPTGGYAFSHGLEGLAAAGLLRDEADVLATVRVQVEEGLAGIELPALCHAHRTALANRPDDLVALDILLSALKPVPAFRDGGAKVGRRFLASAAPFVASPALDGYRDAIAAGDALGHHALTFALACAAAGIAEDDAALAFGAGFVANQATAAVRLGLIGQAAAQRVVAALHPDLVRALRRAQTLSLDDLGAYHPLLDLAGLGQPALAARTFAS